MSFARLIRPAWLPEGPDLAQRWGRLLVGIGAVVLVAGMFNKPPLMNAGLGLGLAGLLLLRPPVWRMPVVWIGLAFSLWVVLSTVAAWLRDQPEAGRIQGPAYGWLALPIVAVAAMDAAWRRVAFRAVLVVAVLAGSVAAVQWTVGCGEGFLSIKPEARNFGRACGLNALSLTYGFVSSLLLIAALAPRETWAAGHSMVWLARVLGAAGVAVSGARSAMIGLIAGATAALLARGRRWLIWGTLAGVALCVTGLVVLNLASERRVQRMLDGENGRWAIWGATMVMITDRPLLGTGGRKAFEAAYPDAYIRSGTNVPNEFAGAGGRAPHAHNTLLAIAAEYGILAGLLHLALIGAVLVATWQARMRQPGGWQLACGCAAAALTAGMFEPFAFQSVGGLGFHAWLGLALGLALSPQVSDRAGR